MKKVLLDTGVFISYCGRLNSPERENKVRSLFDYLLIGNFEILYSQRTENELKRHFSEERRQLLQKCTLASYHFGSEPWDQIEGKIENIGSIINNDSDGEFQLHKRLNTFLKNKKDFRDKGILLDAIQNKCNFFIHENPNDFKKIPIELFKEFNIKCINLLEINYPSPNFDKILK